MQPAAALSPPKLVSLTISGVQPLVYQHETAKPVPHLPAAEQHCMKINHHGTLRYVVPKL